MHRQWVQYHNATRALIVFSDVLSCKTFSEGVLNFQAEPALPVVPNARIFFVALPLRIEGKFRIILEMVFLAPAAIGVNFERL